MLIVVLVLIGLFLTALLISWYWPSYEWAVRMQAEIVTWSCGFLLAPMFLLVWTTGLIVCGSPAIVLLLIVLLA
jgi:hypothetical protein